MHFRRGAIALFALFAGLGQSGCRASERSRVGALEASALAHREKGEYDLAIADYDRIIALEPRRAAAFNSRGITYQLAARYPRAIADYDTALMLDSGMTAALKNRGRAHFYLGHFDQAARDLSAGLAGDTANSFVSVWLHMIRQRLGAADTAELARNIARTDRTRWPSPVAALYLGRITPAQFADSLVTGDSAARALKRCGGAFFLGEYLLWHQRASEARSQFEEAASICPRNETEYMGAVAELRRLDHPATR
jgi:lipoprotein NlpI